MTNTEVEALTLDKYFVSNLNLAYSFRPKKVLKEVTVGFTVYNLFNEKYENNGWASSDYTDTVENRGNYAGYAAQAGTNVMGTCFFPLLIPQNYGIEFSGNIRYDCRSSLPLVGVPGKYLPLDSRYRDACHLYLRILQSRTVCRFRYQYLLSDSCHLRLVLLDVGTQKEEKVNSQQMLQPVTNPKIFLSCILHGNVTYLFFWYLLLHLSALHGY